VYHISLGSAFIQETLMMHSTGSKETKFLRRVGKIAKSDHELRHACPSARLSLCLSVCPSVRMEQLGSQWTDFNYI